LDCVDSAFNCYDNLELCLIPVKKYFLGINK